MPALHAVPQARLDHRRGRGLPRRHPARSDLTEQERLAVEFLDLLSADHHAIDDEIYRRLGEVFTAAQIIELGFTCATSMGTHRFIHTLDPFGTAPPVIAFDPDQVDTAYADVAGRAGRGMSETVLVTGATGLAGANICKLLVERGDAVRALARAGADTGPWSPWGSTSSPATSPTPTTCCGPPPAATRPSTAPPCWAGPARTSHAFRAVNVDGTAARARRRRGPRACAGWSPSAPAPSSTPRAASSARTPRSPTKPSSDPYTVTKMAAFEDAMARAAAGQDVVTTHPGRHLRALAGGQQRPGPDQLQPGPARRLSASGSTSYLWFPVSWVFADDIARGCILALDRGVSGERYMLDGRPEDVVSTAEACNRICELAGLDHRVEDIQPSDDPELAKVFGPTLVAIAAKAAKAAADPPARRPLTESKTYLRLGYDPISLDDGLVATTAWLRDLGKF